jgi:hypothetical protein
LINLKPISNLNCPTCHHALHRSSRQVNAITCTFCASIFWLDPKDEPWRKNAAPLKETLSLLGIGATLKIEQENYKVIGVIEWHLLDRIKLFWNLCDEKGNVHWLIECLGTFIWIKDVTKHGEKLLPFENLQLGKPIPSGYHSQTFLINSKIVGIRYEIHGEVFFAGISDPQVKHYEAFSESGEVLYLIYVDKKYRHYWYGNTISLKTNQITPNRFSLIE